MKFKQHKTNKERTHKQTVNGPAYAPTRMILFCPLHNEELQQSRSHEYLGGVQMERAMTLLSIIVMIWIEHFHSQGILP
ncbi:MAG: hypothetical protein WA116_09875 [Anaerolineaceae bacterium]